VEEVLKYVEENKEKFVEELLDYLRIPSISAAKEHKKDMLGCAKFVQQKLKEAGIKKTRIFKTEGNPLVYGEWLGAKGKPTVLIYGHYDVQPPEPLELWTTPPFEPDIRNGNIYARGADDNKGQNFVHIKSVEAFTKTLGKLPLNVKFILEGEEEVGSESITKFLKSNKKLLKCDAVLISDTSLYDKGIPTINYGLRGLTYAEVEVIGPNRDLHSGSYGGAVANPINVLAKMIAKLHDEKGKITIPGFYKNVKKLTKKEKEIIKKLNFSDVKMARDLKVRELAGEEGYSTLERLWARPTLDCNGIYGGYTGEGAKTVLPSRAVAKISMRLVPNQNPREIFRAFSKYIKAIAPKSVKVKVTEMHGGFPIAFPLNDKAIKAGANAVSRAFGKETVFTREGGSIPIVVDFVRVLKAPVVLMGFGLDSDNIHSPDEHFSLDSFFKGIYSSVYFLEEFSRSK